MAGKPNEKANSHSSHLDAEALQKLVDDGGNNSCCSSMAGGKVNLNLSSSSETYSV